MLDVSEAEVGGRRDHANQEWPKQAWSRRQVSYFIREENSRVSRRQTGPAVVDVKSKLVVGSSDRAEDRGGWQHHACQEWP